MCYVLYQAASAHLRRCRERSVLRAWGCKLANKVGVTSSSGGRSQTCDHHASDVGLRDRFPVWPTARRRKRRKDRPSVAVCFAQDVGNVSPSRSLYGAIIKHVLRAWTTDSPNPIMQHATALTPQTRARQRQAKVAENAPRQGSSPDGAETPTWRLRLLACLRLKRGPTEAG